MRTSGPFFLWYDAWIGLYYNRKERTIYFCPFFCVVFKFELDK